MQYYLLAFLFINPSLFSFPVLTISYYCGFWGIFFFIFLSHRFKSVVLTERLLYILYEIAIFHKYYFLQKLFILQIII